MATSIPSGSLTIFHNASAPVGWTKITTYNDYAIRVVSGTPGTGGTIAFSTAFSPITSNATVAVSGIVALAVAATSPTHSHTGGQFITYVAVGAGITSYRGYPGGTAWINSAGGGGTHTHSVPVPATLSTGVTSSYNIPFDIKYIDTILAQRN